MGSTFKVFFEEPVDMSVTGATLKLAAVSTMTFTVAMDPSGDFAVVTIGGTTVNAGGDSAATYTSAQSEGGIAFDDTQKLNFTASSVSLKTA